MSFNPSYSMTVKEKLSEKTAKGIGLHGINKGKLTDKCCSLAFFYGVTLLSKKLDKETMTLSLDNEKLLEICTYIMIQHFLAVPTVRERERAGKRKFEVSFKKELVGQDLHDKFFDEELDFSFASVCPNCLSFFLRGAFLGAGNITDPERDYRVEFVLGDKKTAESFLKFLSPYIEGKLTKRGTSYVVYIKGSERVESFFTLIGAESVSLDIIERTIEKETMNSLNRSCNCENANTKKTVTASVEVCYAIKKLRESGKYSSLPDELKKTAELREKYPEEPLSSLALLYEGGISRSGLNHRMKKLVELSKE